MLQKLNLNSKTNQEAIHRSAFYRHKIAHKIMLFWISISSLWMFPTSYHLTHIMKYGICPLSHQASLLQISQSKHRLQIVKSDLTLLGTSQKTSGLDDIFDLATVQLQLGHLVKLLIRDGFNVHRAAEELSPNLAPGFRIEILVGDGKVDARIEGRVDVLRTVGGQEENTLERKIKDQYHVICALRPNSELTS